MYSEILKIAATTALRTEGKRLKKKDSNSSGSDDAGGRALEAIADGLDAMDFSNIDSAKSLRNIGAGLVAVGEKLQEEAERVEAGK